MLLSPYCVHINENNVTVWVVFLLFPLYDFILTWFRLTFCSFYSILKLFVFQDGMIILFFVCTIALQMYILSSVFNISYAFCIAPQGTTLFFLQTFVYSSVRIAVSIVYTFLTETCIVSLFLYYIMFIKAHASLILQFAFKYEILAFCVI